MTSKKVEMTVSTAVAYAMVRGVLKNQIVNDRLRLPHMSLQRWLEVLPTKSAFLTDCAGVVVKC